MDVEQKTSIFKVNGVQYSRTQFPLQNSFAMTVHKVQSLSLDSITISFDEEMFAAGQAYTALSRAKHSSNVSISSLTRDAFIVDSEAVAEYERLERIAAASQIF